MATAANSLQNSFPNARSGNKRRPLPKWTDEIRWTAIPHSYFERAIPHFDGIAAGVLGLLLRYTVGERNRDDWEWTAITLSKFAAIFDCTEEGVRKAIDRLCETRVGPDQEKLVLRELRGRNNYYCVNVLALEKLTGRRPDKPKPPQPTSDDEPSSDSGGAGDEGVAAPAASLAAARKRYGANAALVVLPGSDTMVPVESVCSQGSKCCLASGECDTQKDSKPRLVSIQGGRTKDNPHAENKGVNTGKPQLQLGFPVEHEEAGAAFVEAVTEVFVAAVHEDAPASLVQAQFMRLVEAHVDPAIVVQKVKKASSRIQSWGLLGKIVDDAVAAGAGKRKESEADNARLAKGLVAMAKLLPKPAGKPAAEELRDMAGKLAGMKAEQVDDKLRKISRRLIDALLHSLPDAERQQIEKSVRDEAAAMAGANGNAEHWKPIVLETEILERFSLPRLTQDDIWGLA